MPNIYFNKIGTGKPVVFLHGFLESSTMWDYLDFSSTSIAAIYVDIPGHGKSEVLSNTDISIKAIASSIIRALAKKDIHTFDIVGHSMGGYIALEIARQVTHQPKVILLNSNFWEDTAEKKNNRNRVIDIIEKNKELFIQEAVPGLFVRPIENQLAIQSLISEAKNISNEGIIYASIAMRDRPDLTDFAISIANQLVCIQGEKDAIVPLAEMEKRSAKIIPYITLPNTGHMSHIEVSKVVENALTELLLDRL